MLPNSETHASDEIPMEDWRHSRHIHDWMHAGGAGWGLTIAANHQQIRFEDGLIRAEMLRSTKFTSAKVVRGQDVASMNYPPPGRYVFRYSLSSAVGDWKASKAYRTGMAARLPFARSTCWKRTCPQPGQGCSRPGRMLMLDTRADPVMSKTPNGESVP
jgi:hypothetical protein